MRGRSPALTPFCRLTSRPVSLTWGQWTVVVHGTMRSSLWTFTDSDPQLEISLLLCRKKRGRAGPFQRHCGEITFGVNHFIISISFNVVRLVNAIGGDLEWAGPSTASWTLIWTESDGEAFSVA